MLLMCDLDVGRVKPVGLCLLTRATRGCDIISLKVRPIPAPIHEWVIIPIAHNNKGCVART